MTARECRVCAERFGPSARTFRPCYEVWRQRDAVWVPACGAHMSVLVKRLLAQQTAAAVRKVTS